MESRFRQGLLACGGSAKICGKTQGWLALPLDDINQQCGYCQPSGSKQRAASADRGMARQTSRVRASSAPPLRRRRADECETCERRAHTFEKKDGQVDVLFFPKDAKREHGLCPIRDLLYTAQASVEVAIYNLNHDCLVTELERAKRNRSLAVRVITDDKAADGVNKEMVERLHAVGIEVITDRSKSKIMHHKFAVIDDKILLHGSFNWTETAELDNNENLLVIHDVGLALQFSYTFHRLWHDFGGPRYNKRAPLRPPAHTELSRQIKPLFFPPPSSLQSMLDELRLAEHTIDIAMMTFTSDAVRNVLLEMQEKNNSLVIRVFVDDHHLKDAGSDVAELARAGKLLGRISCKTDANRTTRTRNPTMHHKFAVLDAAHEKASVVSGSFNWSDGATTNFEAVLIIKIPDIARRFADEFEEMWKEGQDFMLFVRSNAQDLSWST